MLIRFNCYNASNESEERVIQTDLVEEVSPHANVNVDPGAVSTTCSQLRFSSGATTIVLLPYSDLKNRLSSFAGIVDQTGTIS